MTKLAISEPQHDTFTIAGETGTIFERSDKKVFKHYAIQVVGVDDVPTGWLVDLEGSLDGVNWDTILTHATGNGNGKVYFSGVQICPAKFVRSKVVSLTLGSATAIDVYILGTP